MSSEASQTSFRGVPDDAPPRPDNLLLEHYAWRPMWVEDNNAIWTVVGDTGDGKSMASIRIAETIDPDFTIDQVANSVVEFLQLVMDDDLGQGSVIVFEEASVEASAYDWHSESNRVFSKVLDTWRNQNRMAIINLPDFSKLEPGARQRTTAIVEMVEAVPWKDYSTAKFKEPHKNNVSGDWWKEFPVLKGKKRKKIRFRLPSQDLVEAYDDIKDEYTDQLNEELLEQLLQKEEEQEAKQLTAQRVADQILDDEGVESYLKDNHGQQYIDRDLIELEYGIGNQKSKKVKKVLEEEVDVDVL
jgi:hypothetical protein